MGLASLVRPEHVFPDLSGSDRQSVLKGIAERLADAGVKVSPDALYRKLMEREELGSTCVGPSVAIPHCKVKGLDDVVVSVGVAQQAVDFGDKDDEPVRLFFTVISPHNDPAGHLQSLALISRWIKENGHVDDLVDLGNREKILDFLRLGVEPEE